MLLQKNGVELGCATICINPGYMDLCEPYVKGSETMLCPVCDFPFGTSSTESKVKQIEIVAKYDTVKEVDIAHAGIVAARNGKHVIRHVGPAMAHEGFQLIQMIRIDGDVAVVQFVHVALLFVVPRHFARRNRDDVARWDSGRPSALLCAASPSAAYRRRKSRRY